MLKFLALGLVCLILIAAPVRAGGDDDDDDNGDGRFLTQLMINQIKAAAIERQYKYNNDFDDQIKVCGCKGAQSVECAARVNATMTVFCNDGSFQSWQAPPVIGKGMPIPQVTDLAVLKSQYYFFGVGVFTNFSAHELTDTRVAVFEKNGEIYANLSSRLTQTAITFNSPGDPADTSLSLTRNTGYYNNMYKVKSQEPTLTLCMVRFVSATDVNYKLAEPVPAHNCGVTVDNHWE